MNNNNKNIQYFWRLLIHVQRLKVHGNQSGYAMIITSILAVLTFSMLSVYLFSAGLYKSVASSVVDTGTTFYAAETELNKRAEITRQRFESYVLPSGTSPQGNTIAEQMSNCMSSSNDPAVIGSGDLGCWPVLRAGQTETALRNTDGSFKYRESSLKNTGQDSYKNSIDANANINYRTYSFGRDVTNYVSPGIVATTKVETGEPFAGLNMLDYRYRIYVSAAKQIDNGFTPSDTNAQTMLQMEFSNRLIPLFQFAAFYQNDLEITSSSEMVVNGPIHSNSALRLVPGGTLTLLSKATANQGIYKGLVFVAGHGSANTTTSPVRTVKLNSTSLNVASAWTKANELFPDATITAAEPQLKPKAPVLNVPDAGNLGRTGKYFEKADIKVDFTPLDTKPFTVYSRVLGRELTDSELQSLRQPVLAKLDPANLNGDRVTLCPAVTNVTAPAILNATQQASLRRAMQIEMLDWIRNNPSAPTNYSFLATPVGPVGTSLRNRSGISTLQDNWTWHQLAAMTTDCWLPAPMKVLANQRDRREMITSSSRRMTILQTDIKSMAVWNGFGQIWDGSNLTALSDPLYVRSAVTAAPNTLNAPTGYTMDELGLGANDATEGGLVWHFSIDKGNTAKVASYPEKESIYGFGFSGGKYLPGPLSLVTDQAAYIQGDFNDARDFGGVTTFISQVPVWTARTLTHKKPAALMADTITVLSNSCLDADAQLNCFNLVGGNTLPAVQTGQASSINAAFLSRTPQSTASGTNSGGLNNYFRMLENWNNRVFTYSGSMVSLGVPQEFSGGYRPGGGTTVRDPTSSGYYVYTIPTRNFSYDTSFNAMPGLPPMTPRAIYLKQKVFKRSYNASDLIYGY